MADSILTPTVIAKEALMQLDNALVMGNQVHRDYETEFTEQKIGSSVTIRKPVQFSVSDGATLDLQDTQEGSLTLSVDKRKHVAFDFPSVDLTLKIDMFSERYIKPAMIQLANQVDSDLLALYKQVPNWVGTAGQTINSFSDWSVGLERLDEFAVPNDGNRVGMVTPTDYYGLANSFTGSYVERIAQGAIEKARLPMIGGSDVFMAQNVQTHTVGAHGGTPLIRGASQSTTYASSLTTDTMDLATDGWTTNSGLKEGDVFTISGVYAVNPVTKATLNFLRQFRITANVTTNVSAASATTLSISPAIITSGPYQNVSAAPANDTAITMIGTASTGYRQNMLFHKNAFALVTVPLKAPASAKSARQTYKGLSVRYVTDYDITNDREIYRFDVLYGVKTIDPRLATRISGTA
jgi:hypothetical protein